MSDHQTTECAGMDATDLFYLAVLFLEQAEPIPPAIRHWLVSGFKRHAAGEPLELALGLSSHARTNARNRALRDAANEIATTLDDLSTWAISNRLADAIKRFESRVLPKVKGNAYPDLPPIDAALLRAFRSGARPLTSARRLHELLR